MKKQADGRTGGHYRRGKPTQFVGFIALFLAAGAAGFRYAAVRNRLTTLDPAAEPEQTVYAKATQRAATLGLVGATVQAVLFVMQLPGAAAHAHLSTGQLVTTDPQTAAKCLLLLAAIAGLALAATRRRSGWPVAAVGIVGGQLAAILSGRWPSLVNPVHALLAGLWIGTLSVLVVAGLPTVLRHPARADRRGHGERLLAARADLRPAAGALGADHGLAAPQPFVVALDHAVRLRPADQAVPRGPGLRTRRLELAAAAATARQRGSSPPHPPLGGDGAGRGDPRARRHRDTGESAVAQTSPAAGTVAPVAAPAEG